ncbi:MAG: hypothetical protein AAGA30_10340, partial [Planctomycetota bacterium]
MSTRKKLSPKPFFAIGLFVALSALADMAAGQTNPIVEDIALLSGLQDNFGFSVPDHLKRGRASICADFN